MAAPDPTSGLNAQWLARSRAAVWHPCTQMKVHETLPLVPIARGAGAWLFDFEGRRYLDAVSSWWVNLFGHANPRINAALTRQLAQLEHVMLAGFTHRPVVELSERLAALAPAGLGHAFYGSDGAAATEIALKMSFHSWRNRGHRDKRGFVSLAGSYHGETLGALAVTDVALFRDVYAPLLNANAIVPCPDPRRGITVEAAAAALEAHLVQHHGTTAALIVEPLVQGASGMVMYDAAYLRHARALCTRFDIHLIADEIMTGFGRTGTLFAWERAGAAGPDFMCLSKGITGGYLPLSSVLTTDAVFDTFYSDDVARGFLHSHSYTGNALACAAALASLKIFDDEQTLVHVSAMAGRLAAGLAQIARHPHVGEVRQRGLMAGIELVQDKASKAEYDYGLRMGHKVCLAARKREVMLRPLGNVVVLVPPLSIQGQEIDLLVEALDGAIREVCQ